MAMIIYNIIANRGLTIGFIVRIIAVIFLCPKIHLDWFLPFIDDFINHPNIDPWSAFLDRGGDLESFPYGLTMLIAFFPLTYLGSKIGSVFGGDSYLLGLGLRFSLLIIDYLLFLILTRILPENKNEVILFYWLSPLIIYTTYWHGQLDIFPTLLIVIGFLLILRKRFQLSGLIFGLSCASKLSMLLALPFPLIYLWQNKRIRPKFLPFTRAFILVSVLLILVPFLSHGYRSTVIGTSEIQKLFAFNLPISPDYKLYLMPLIFSILVYIMWRLKRSNFSLLLSITGLSFLVSVLTMPPSPGWYIWLIPFLVIYQIKTDLIGKLIVSLFTLLAIFVTLPNSKGSEILFLKEVQQSRIINFDEQILFTILIAIGAILCTRIFRESIRKNDYYLLTRKPILIGISGEELDTQSRLVNSLEGIFGTHSIERISTISYRRWHPSSPMWETMSLKDPMGYDFQKLSYDLQIMKSGRRIDHQSNFRAHKLISSTHESQDKAFIITTGYHLLNSNSLSGKFDIQVYIEDKYNLYLNSKDFINKSKLLNIRNKLDFDNSGFSISNHQEKADLIFTVSPIYDDFSELYLINDVPLKLNINLADAIYVERITKALISICGLSINTKINRNRLTASITVEGSVSSYDIALSAFQLIPQIDEIIDIEPKWEKDISGIIQLFILMEINHKVRGL